MQELPEVGGGHEEGVLRPPVPLDVPPPELIERPALSGLQVQDNPVIIIINKH